jgi:hypothetical protein
VFSEESGLARRECHERAYQNPPACLQRIAETFLGDFFRHGFKLAL